MLQDFPRNGVLQEMVICELRKIQAIPTHMHYDGLQLLPTICAFSLQIFTEIVTLYFIVILSNK